MPFHAASNLPVEELKCEAMKNLQKALIGKDAGKAVVLLGAALLFQASIFRVFSADLARSRHKHERFVPA